MNDSIHQEQGPSDEYHTDEIILNGTLKSVSPVKGADTKNHRGSKSKNKRPCNGNKRSMSLRFQTVLYHLKK